MATFFNNWMKINFEKLFNLINHPKRSKIVIKYYPDFQSRTVYAFLSFVEI